MTLPSNASPDIYKNNKTSNFQIQLPERLDLHGHWQVALLEIMYPNTFFNVQKGENWIKVFEDTRPYSEPDDEPIYSINSVWEGAGDMEEYWKEVSQSEIKPGFYPTSDALLEAIESILSAFTHLNPDGTVAYKRPFTEENSGNLRLFFAPHLALQLGLAATGPIRTAAELRGIRTVDVNLGIPPQLYVYLNIVSEQIVGHTRAPLLRSLPTNMDGRFGTMSTYRFDIPVYRDLKTKSFDTIEVNIRTPSGHFAPFHHGTATLLCHFKKV